MQAQPRLQARRWPWVPSTPPETPAMGPVAADVLLRIDGIYAGCGVQMKVGLTLLREYLTAHGQCEVMDSLQLEDMVRQLRPDVKSSTIYATRLRQACRTAGMPLLNAGRERRSGTDDDVPEPAQAEEATAVAAEDADSLEDLIVKYFKNRIRTQCQCIDLHRLYRRAELEVLKELDGQLGGMD